MLMNCRHAILISLAAVLLCCGVSHADSILWTNTAGGNWSLASNWNPNRVPGPADDATLEAGSYSVTNDISTNVNSLTIPNSSVTFTVAGGTVFNTLGALNFPGGTINVSASGSINCGGLNFTGGNINGPGVINLSGSNSWGGGGVFQPASPGTLTVGNGATLNMYSGNNHDLPGWTLNNNGTNLHTGGAVQAGYGTVINNAGIWLEEVNVAINNAYNNGASTFVNTGTFCKTNSTGTTTFEPSFLLNNSGLVDVESGALAVNGGGTSSGVGAFNSGSGARIDFNANYNFFSGSSFSGAGSVTLVSGTATLNGSITSANLQLTGGVLTGTNTLAGTLNLIGGSVEGVMTVGNSSVLNIAAGGANVFFYALTLTNHGTVNWTNTALYSGVGTQIYNYGLWDAQSDNVFYGNYNGGPGTVFDNFGMFRKSGNTGTTTLDAAFTLNNTGTMDVRSGLLSVAGGLNSAGGTFTGNGVTQMTSGTGTLNGAIHSANLQLAGGTLTGTNVLVGTLNLTGGYVEGAMTVSNNSVLNIAAGGGNVFFYALTLTNNGTVKWTNTALYSGVGTQIYNYGLWDAQSDNNFAGNFNGNPGTVFENFGTFRKSGNSGATTLDTAFTLNNLGTVDIQSGLLSVSGLESAGGTFTGSGVVRMTSGTATLNGAIYSTNLLLAGGTLTGTNVLVGTLNLTGGDVEGAMTVSNNSVLNIAAPGNLFFFALTLTNYGTVNWTNTPLYSGLGTQIYNYGLWDAQSDNGFYGNYDGNPGTVFDNFGTFRKSGSTGATTLYSAFTLNNSGLVDVESGTLAVNSGGASSGSGVFNSGSGAAIDFNASYNFFSSSSFSGAGIVALAAGTATVNGTITNANVQLSGGTLTGTNVLAGTLTLTGGNLEGVMTVSNQGVLNIAAPGNMFFYALTLTNYGTVNWTNTPLYSGLGTHIYNYGLWDAQSDNVFYGNYGGNPGTVFDNLGTFRKSGNAGTTTLDAALTLNNSGLVDVESGTLAVNGGGASSGSGVFNSGSGAAIEFRASYNFFSSSSFSGAGIVALATGTATVNGTITNANVQLSGGTLAGTNVLAGTLTLTGGYLEGVMTVSNQGVLNIAAGGGNVFFYALTLTNHGTVNWTNTSLYSGAGTQIYNYGLWDAQSDNVFYGNYGGNPGTVFDNIGTFRKSGNAGTTTLDAAFTLNNTGTVDARSGAMNISGGGANSGTFNAAPGANNNFTASYTFNNGSAFTGLGLNSLIGGTLTFNGSITTTNLEWNSGTLAGTLIISYGGTFYIATGNNHLMPAVTLQNYGTVIHTGGIIYQGLGGLIDNEGIWLEQTDAAFNQNNYGGATAFLNNGTFNKNSTTGATTFDTGFPFNNNGTLEVLSGAVTLNGPYNPSSPTLLFGVSNLTSYGSVNIAGAATLSGTLGLQLLNGYVPAVSNVISPLSYGSRSGVFSAFNFPALPSGESWTPGYGSASVSLTVSGPGSNDTLSITGTVTDNQGNPIAGANVFAAIDPASFTNLVQNGDFETPSIGTQPYATDPINSTAITGWTVFGPFGDNVALIGPNYGTPGESGVQFFDPTGTTGGAGITQTLATVSNQSYVLSFYQGTENQHGLGTAAGANALGVTIGTNFLFFPETAGNHANPDWTERRIAFTANSDFTTVSFQDDTGFDANNSYLDNVVVGPPDYGVMLGAVTDANGHYQIAVGSGTFQVGLDGLPLLGFSPVTNQSVTITTSSGTVNFVAPPFSGQLFAVSATVNPPGSGNMEGGGTFPQNSTITVTATPVSVPPFVFVNWTENGYFQSASSNYSFTVTRSRQLVANFTLPLYSLTASNNPVGAGTVSGVGSYFYGTTNVLTATPNFGYNFSNWTQGAVVLGTSPTLSVGSYSNALIVANYSEANLAHTVTTATSPPGLTVVSGAGVYINGQTANFSAPLLVTNPPDYYYFSQYTLSNTVASASAAFSKTFSTLDPTNLQYVAVYTAQNILPLLIKVTANFANPVPATANLLFTLQFDRAMQTNPAPVILLTNSAPGAIQPGVPTNGYWTTTVFSDDTYHTPPTTIAPGMDGTNQLYASGAQDLNGDVLALTNAAAFVVVSTPPPNPVLSLASSNSASAVVAWSGYATPANLGGFRVFIESTNFTSVAGLPVLTGLGSSASSFQFSGLALDTVYYVAVEAFDVAGNASTNVTSLPIFLPSTIPPAVTVQQTPVGDATASLSWSSYNTASLFGFTGFQVYYGTANFTSVAGLVPAATLGPSASSFQVSGLNRANTYYFAVVGYNDTNGFNPNVTTATWSDPYSGNITASTAIGGAGQGVVNIYHSMVVQNNATLTIQPGTTLLFAPGTSLTIQQGSLVANGTALAPIILDSANDTAGKIPAAGDWGGVTLGGGAGSSSLSFVEILYGGGLTVNGCSPAVYAFTANNNSPCGLGLQNGAALVTSSALLTANAVGAQQADTAVLTITNSVIENNGTNALAGGASPMAATLNWWGTPVATNLTPELQGNVTYAPFLTYEPLLTPALGAVGGVTQVGAASASLQLACRTADSMRLSEDFTFGGVFFTPFTNYTSFPFSPGGGLKHIYAQFRSITGATNSPLELDLTYITQGPVIQAFSLTQGETLNRPLTVTGSATAVLGMEAMEFYVDGVLQSTNAGGSFSQFLDISAFPNAIHQVELLARDQSGNIATLTYDVIIALTPPLAPVITVPGTDLLTNTDFVTIGGTAEAGMNIQVTRNGQIVGMTNADSGGNFTISNAVLVEGVNNIIAVAANHTGTTPSAVRHITVETIPPAQLVLNAPVYIPGRGLAFNWQFPAAGKQAVTFQLFWSAASFTSASQATYQSPVLNTMSDTVNNLANGTYYFAVVGYDAAGNPSPLSALVSFAYDSSPPSLTIAYSEPSPLGAGPLAMVLTSSKALAATPSLTIKPFGAASPILLTLTNAALNTWQTAFNVTPATPSGFVTVLATAQDQLGNVFVGAPTGPVLIFDTTPPSGTVTTIPGPPVQATNNTNITVSLTLNELAAVGMAPTLAFLPPVGASVSVPLTGAGSNWLGALPLTPAMGSGFGSFTMSAQDSLGNVGTNIVSGGQLEIYNTALPSPPAVPTGLTAASLPGGRISLSWNTVSNAQIYRLYREPGSIFALPGVLDQDNLNTNAVLDLPPVDGLYSYAVSASRLGSESALSAAVLAISDRAAPPAPANILVVLAASGVQITWQEPSGLGVQIPNHYNVYRNGALIQTVSTMTPVVDYPPRGTDTYAVAASDFLGNQSLSTNATINLPVSPVTSLSVVVAAGQGPVLSWVSTDPTAVGFNIYRNGVKQNTSLLTASTYDDGLPLGGGVQYGVTAVNNSFQESPPRQVNVYPVALGLLVNSLGSGTNHPLLTGYFDQFQAGVSNIGAAGIFPLAQLTLTRAIPNLSPLSITQAAPGGIAPGANAQESVVFPESPSLSPQTIQVSAFQQTDSAGSSVVYQSTFNLIDVRAPAAGIIVSADELPLAGGLSSFQVQIYNRGYADMDIVVFRANGNQPGDPYLSVQNGLGQEVSRASYTGAPPGTTLLADGSGFVDVPPGSSLVLTITNVLVPAALSGATNTAFVAVVTNLYNQIGTAAQTVSGPLSGGMVSSLAQTPYYGTAQTDKANYVNNEFMVISGQALSTANGAPVANAALNIGFAAGAFRWSQPVTTDASGNYQYTYTPPAGFGGSITIWAAHPLVVDQLNQAQVNVYRLYDTPSSGSITMSQNDSLNFSIQLINPGSLPLTGFTTTFQAYQVSGSTQTPITTIAGTNLTGPGFVLGPNQSASINLQLTAAINAPTSAQVVFTFTSAEGASVTFTGTVALLPAVPVVSVQTPAVGYLEVSVNRGSQFSGEISIANNGLQTLQGITLIPPTNGWMQLNLPVSTDGQIHLPDLAVGQSNNFRVVFTPPASLPLALYSDSITIRGTNISAPYPAVNVYALVTSDLTGAVQFDVSDILGQQVSGASVRLHNDLVSADVGPVATDTNGLVTITNLEEGGWNWQVVAPGCSANAGTVTIIADQTVSQATTLSRSLVTVTFNVVPVPFTDVYEIQVEQTFQTSVPAPVLVINPPFIDLTSFSSGFQTNFTVSVQNYGLIQITGLNINPAQANGGVLTPLINYIPVLLPFQTVNVPFTFLYNQQAQAAIVINTCLGDALPVQNTFNPDVYLGLASILTGQAANSDGSGAQLIQSALSIIGVGLATNSPGSLENYVYGSIGSVVNCIVTEGSQAALPGGGGGGGGGGSFGGGGGGQGTPAQFEPSSPPVFTQAAACFAPETQVLMADGTYKAIADIQTNDVVRSGVQSQNVAVVNGAYTLAAGRLCEIGFAPDVAGAPDSVLATEEHPFWVDGRGWVPAGSLAAGDYLLDAQGRRVRILANQVVKGVARVYSLSLSGDTAFYANGVLVHDSCGTIPPATLLKVMEVVK